MPPADTERGGRGTAASGSRRRNGSLAASLLEKGNSFGNRERAPSDRLSRLWRRTFRLNLGDGEEGARIGPASVD